MNIDCKYQTSAWNDTKFYVVDVPGPVILGLPACEKLGLVAITCQRVEVHQIDAASPINDLKKKYPEQLTALGSSKTQHISRCDLTQSHTSIGQESAI